MDRFGKAIVRRVWRFASSPMTDNDCPLQMRSSHVFWSERDIQWWVGHESPIHRSEPTSVLRRQLSPKDGYQSFVRQSPDDPSMTATEECWLEDRHSSPAVDTDSKTMDDIEYSLRACTSSTDDPSMTVLNPSNETVDTDSQTLTPTLIVPMLLVSESP